MSSDYRDPPSAFSASWDLPPGYYIGSIQFRRHISHAPISIYLCYEAQETILDKPYTIASGRNGEGNDFNEALVNAKIKVDESLAAQRHARANPQTTAKPKPPVDLDNLKIDFNL